MATLGTMRALRQFWFLVGLAACGGGAVTDAPGPATPPVDTTKPPTVQRASITVRVAIDPGDAAIATTTGVSASGVTVRITRTTPGVPPQTGTTGSDGSVRFDNLLEGVYQVSVDRPLTAMEVARLAAGDREVSIFAGGGNVILSPPSNRELAVSLVGARRGSVVISEIFAYNGPLQFTGTNYGLGTYVEFYNNSDTTQYLDGMLWVTISGLFSDYGPAYPCNQYPQMLRLDSTAVYSSIIMAFPGSGREYPIQPGEARVLAMDAIDHRAAAPEKQQVDLSHAQFEQYFSDSDTDNPESANMDRVFTLGSTGAFGRGFPVNGGKRMYALMLPAARTAMTLVQLPRTTGATGIGTPYDTYRIPREYVIDVLGVELAPTIFGYENASPQCSPWASAVYERAPAPLIDDNYRKAIARKSLGRTSDGREILQRTRTSARDFEYVDPLRRSLDK